MLEGESAVLLESEASPQYLTGGYRKKYFNALHECAANPRCAAAAS